LVLDFKIVSARAS